MSVWVVPCEWAIRPRVEEEVSERTRAVRAGRSRVAMCVTVAVILANIPSIPDSSAILELEVRSPPLNAECVYTTRLSEELRSVIMTGYL